MLLLPSDDIQGFNNKTLNRELTFVHDSCVEY